MKIVVLLSLLFSGPMLAFDWQVQALPGKPSLRGSAVKDGVLWATGTNNSVFVSDNQGKTWRNASVTDSVVTDFRDIQVFDNKTAIVMGVGSGEQSRLLLTLDRGQSWQLLHVNPDPDGFYDAIGFWDRNRGLLLGDPVDGYYVIKRTQDGGKTWQRIEREKLPPMLSKEAAFAASGNTLIVGDNGKAWFTTGGFDACVYYSSDFGQSWQRSPVPLHRLNQTSGGYALALNHQGTPFVMGGDYKQRDGHYPHLSYLGPDGHWLVPDSTQLGLRTAMACDQQTCITTGKLGTDISHDQGMRWKTLPVSAQTKGFYTLAQEDGLFLGAGHDGLVGVYPLPN